MKNAKLFGNFLDSSLTYRIRFYVKHNVHIYSIIIIQIKSYESISSLGSDGAKMNTIGSGGGNSTIGTIHSDHHEPYYDTVPIEETDDDIEPDENNSSSKNTTSSLPKIFDRQISADVGGIAGERSSNYMNIDYFLS